MANKPQRILLFVVICVMLLAFSSYILPITPKAYALAPTIQEKGQTFLSNVIGLNLDNYNVTQETSSVESSNTYLGVIPQDNVLYHLTSKTSKLDAQCTFVSGNLQMIQILGNKVFQVWQLERLLVQMQLS